MKKKLILFLLLLCGASLSAQTFRNVRLYVPPVAGGSTEANDFFYKHVIYEAALQRHDIVRIQKESRFTLKGSVIPYKEFIYQENLNTEKIVDAMEVLNEYRDNEEYVFSLELIESATDKLISKQYLVYKITDNSTAELVSVIVNNLISVFPSFRESDLWRNKWLYLNLNGLWVPRIYMRENQEIHWANFGVGLSAELHFANHFSADVGLQFAQEWVVVVSGEEYVDYTLEIPLSVRVVFKPLNYLMLEPYAGISVNFSIMGTTYPSPLSWFAGFQIGLKAGPGMFIIDPRFSMDFFPSIIPSNQVDYSRILMQIGIGYKYGFFSKDTGSLNYR